MKTKTKTTWRKVKLGEVVDIIDGDRGKNYPRKDELLGSGYCVFLDAKNVSGTKLDFSSAQFITERKHNLMRKGQLQKNDFVLTTRGTVGNVAYYNANIPYDCMRINSGMVILRSKREVITDNFFYSFLISRDFRNQTESLKTGSAQPQLPIRDLKLFEIELPPLTDQKRIADILSAFDDKIELNNKISKNLEATAQAIFKEWFIDSEKLKVKSEKLPKGWEEKRLGEIMQFEYGRALKAEERKTGNIPVVGSSGIVGMHDKKLVVGPGIVIGRKGTVGSVIWIDTDFYPIDTTFYVVSPLSLYFCYFVLKRQKFITGDSAVPGLNRNTALSSEIAVPQKKIIDRFEKQVKPLFQKMYSVKMENQKLAALRDLLLPKLMKGEIRV